MVDRAQPELLSLSLELWHPDCWALQVTDSVDAELFAYGTLTDGQVARERYIVSGDSEAALDQTVSTIRESPLTTTVAELGLPQSTVQYRLARAESWLATRFAKELD